MIYSYRLGLFGQFNAQLNAQLLRLLCLAMLLLLLQLRRDDGRRLAEGP